MNRIRLYVPQGISGLAREASWISVDFEDNEFPVAVTCLFGPEAIPLVRSHLRSLDCQTLACDACAWRHPCSPQPHPRLGLQLIP